MEADGTDSREQRSTTLAVASMEYPWCFIMNACTVPTRGCSAHVAWDFYEKDRRPASAGGYDKFQEKLDATEKIMEYFLFIQCP